VRGVPGNRHPYRDALFLSENRGPQEQASALIHKKQRELGKFALRFASSKKRFEIFTRERWRLY
jgi:hypothetical protein